MKMKLRKRFEKRSGVERCEGIIRSQAAREAGLGNQQPEKAEGRTIEVDNAVDLDCILEWADQLEVSPTGKKRRSSEKELIL